MEKKGKLLIVDDVAENIDILIALLKDDYMIAAARNGKRALELAEKQQPDLILLDIVMPGMSGYQVCHELKARESTQNIPIVFITAVSEAMDEAKSFELGGVDYITNTVYPGHGKGEGQNPFGAYKRPKRTGEKKRGSGP